MWWESRGKDKVGLIWMGKVNWFVGSETKRELWDENVVNFSKKEAKNCGEHQQERKSIKKAGWIGIERKGRRRWMSSKLNFQLIV